MVCRVSTYRSTILWYIPPIFHYTLYYFLGLLSSHFSTLGGAPRPAGRPPSSLDSFRPARFLRKCAKVFHIPIPTYIHESFSSKHSGYRRFQSTNLPPPLTSSTTLQKIHLLKSLSRAIKEKNQPFHSLAYHTSS